MPNPNFRVEIPRQDSTKLIKLANRNIAKHIDDGAGSKLVILNMSGMADKTTLANEQDKLADTLNRNKEMAYEARNIALGWDKDQGTDAEGTLNFYIKASRDVLAGVYKAEIHRLGDYGFTVNKSSGATSIVIPVNAAELIKLGGEILAQIMYDVASSPLRVLDVPDFTAKHTTALTKHNLAEKLNRDKETAIGNRNQFSGFAEGQKVATQGTLLFYVTSVRDVLLGINKGREFQLGNWGFDISFRQATGRLTLVTTVLGEILAGMQAGVTQLLPGIVITPAMTIRITCTDPITANVILDFWFGLNTTDLPGADTILMRVFSDQTVSRIFSSINFRTLPSNDTFVVKNSGSATGHYKIEIFE